MTEPQALTFFDYLSVLGPVFASGTLLGIMIGMHLARLAFQRVFEEERRRLEQEREKP